MAARNQGHQYDAYYQSVGTGSEMINTSSTGATSGVQMIDAYEYMDNQNRRISDEFESPPGSDHMMSPPLEPLDSNEKHQSSYIQNQDYDFMVQPSQDHHNTGI